MILRFGFQIDLFISNIKMHLFIEDYIGWITTFVFGSMIFVTLTIGSIKNCTYKNVSAIKYFMEDKDLNLPFYKFVSNMSAKEDIFCILFINVIMMIFYFYKFDYIILLISIYLLFLLFDLIESSLVNIHMEDPNKLFQLSMSNYIEKKLTNDLKKTKLQRFGNWIDFDINLLFTIHDYIIRYEYNKIEDSMKVFDEDTKFFQINLKYIIEKKKIEYVASYYNLQLYFDSLVSFINKIQNKKSEKLVKEELTKIDYIVSYYLENYEEFELYKIKYTELHENLKKVYKKFNL